MAAQNSQFEEETRSNHRNTTFSIKNLEVQMGQIAEQVVDSQAQGTLLSATIQNLKNHQSVNVVETIDQKEKFPDLEIRFPCPQRVNRK